MCKLYKSLLLVISILVSVIELSATHVAGGSMSYRCLGNDRYEVKLEFRRDCFNGADNAQFDSLASVFIYNRNQLVLTLDGDGIIEIPFMGDDTLNEILTSECNVIGGDVCVQTTTYMDTIILPPIEDGYILAYQRCCRNISLNNIIDPLQTGGTYWVKITEAALESCNSSPAFLDWPDVYICVDDTLRFDHSAFDADGDSLVYYMCAPSIGATEQDPQPNAAIRQNPGPPFPSVAYVSGFSENNMMGGSPISIDENTGQILAVPNQVGQFLIGVCVREFRDGVLLSEVRREFEYNVRVCGRDPVAAVEPGALVQCDGLQVQFVNNSTSNFLPVDSLDFTWIFDYPDNSLTSNEYEPLFTFPESGLYTVAMIVTDGVCVDTAFSEIGVAVVDEPDASFAYASFDCDGTTELQLTNNTVSVQSTDYEWIINSSQGSDTVRVRDPIVNVGIDTMVDVTLRIYAESGCHDTLVTENIILNTIPLGASFNDQIICNGDDAVVFATDIPNLSVDISPSDNIVDDGNGNFVFPNFTGEQDFIISLSDGFCSLEDTVTIIGADDPSFPFEDIIQCGEAIVGLNPVGPDFYTYNWESPQGVPLIRNESNPAVSLSEDGEFYVTVSTSLGSSCFFVDTVTVDVVDLPEVNILPSAQFVYCENTVVDISLDRNYPGITWKESGSGLIIGTGQTITLSDLANSLEIEVTVMDENGCMNMDFVDIQFIEAPRFNIENFSDTEVCSGGSAIIYADSDHPIEWTFDDGTVVGTGNQIELSNLTSDTRLTATASNDLGCTFTRNVFIEILDNPIVDFTSLQDVAICDNQIFTLELNTDDEVTWSYTDGSEIGSGAEITISEIANDTSLSVVVTNDFGCATTETFIVDVDDTILPEVDFDDVAGLATCIGSGIELELNSMDSVIWYDELGNVLGTGAQLVIDSLSQPTVYQVEVIDDRRCNARDTFMVDIFEDIGLDIEFGQDTINYCQGSDVSIIVQSSIPNLNIEWLVANDVIGTGIALSGYNPVGDVTLISMASDNFGCVDSDTVVLQESIIDAEILGNQFVCFGDEVELQFRAVSSDGYSLDWNPKDDIVSDDGDIITVAPQETTTYTANYVKTDGCQNILNYTVEVDGFFDGLMADASPQEILLGQSTDLFTDQNPDYNYVWSPSESLDDALTAEPVATPDVTTIYTVQVTDDNGCIESDTVEVRVVQPTCDDSDIFVPNMFTPNGDLFNDTWRIESNFLDEFELHVYDRWGEEVFESTDQDIEWDGSYNNKELEPDVYGYYLRAVCINGLEYEKQGNVTIVR